VLFSWVFLLDMYSRLSSQVNGSFVFVPTSLETAWWMDGTKPCVVSEIINSGELLEKFTGITAGIWVETKDGLPITLFGLTFWKGVCFGSGLKTEIDVTIYRRGILIFAAFYQPSVVWKGWQQEDLLIFGVEKFGLTWFRCQTQLTSRSAVHFNCGKQFTGCWIWGDLLRCFALSAHKRLLQATQISEVF